MKSTRTVLTSLLMVGLVAALLGGATYAVFSDTETSNCNQMVSGTIDMEVDGQNPWTQSTYSAVLEDIKPCGSYLTTTTVKNVGENEMDVYKLVRITGYGGGLCPEPEMIAEEQLGAQYDYIAPYINYVMVVNQTEIVSVTGLESIDGVYIHLGVLAPGATMTVKQTYSVHCNMGNEYQGDTLGFSVEFYGVQTVGGPHTPTNVASYPYIAPTPTLT